jgi:hypothetical protein
MPSGSPKAGHGRHCRCCHLLAVVTGGVADSVGDCARFLPRLPSRTYTRCSCIMFARLHSKRAVERPGRQRRTKGRSRMHGMETANSTCSKDGTASCTPLLQAANQKGPARPSAVEALCSTASAVRLLVLSTGTPGKKIADFSGGMLVQRYWGQQCMNPLQHQQKAVEHHSLHLPSEALAQPCTIG